MFYTPKSPNLANTPFIVSTNELLESSSRRIMFCCALVYGFCFCTIGMLWPTMLSGTLWLITLVVTLGTGLSMRLIRQHVAVAQALWHSSVILAISLAFFLLDFQEVALLLALLPFVAALSAGWRAIVFEEVAIVMLLIWFFQLQIGQDIPPLATMIMIIAILSGLLGGILVYTFSTIAHWSLIGFEQANMHMRKAQEHRAELAQTVRALDQAYYRLERSNVALVAARKAAEEAERFKSEFVATVSHELRTPLTSIMGFTAMLSHDVFGGLPERAYEPLSHIEHNSKRLLRLIDDILDFSKLEAGRFHVDLYPVSISSVVSTVVNTLQPQVQERNLELRVDVPHDAPLVHANSERLEQVLMNLIANAIKFTDHGSILVRVTYDNERLRCSVSDTGIGIAPEHLHLLFQEFRQIDNHHTRSNSGTGLGLAISKRLMEVMGGTLTVESSLGAGSTFTCELQLATERLREQVAGSPYTEVS